VFKHFEHDIRARRGAIGAGAAWRPARDVWGASEREQEGRRSAHAPRRRGVCDAAGEDEEVALQERARDEREPREGAHRAAH
jgi:hypothetical protein